jgi:type IV secretion system protein VirB10
MENQTTEYETTPEAATSFETSGVSHSAVFNRKKVLIVLTCAFAFIICGGLLLNINKKKSGGDESDNNRAARVPQGFLQDELNKTGRVTTEGMAVQGADAEDSALPEITEITPYTAQNTAYPAAPSSSGTAAVIPPQQQGGGGAASSGAPARNTADYSALIPAIEGSLFGGSRAQNSAASSGTYAEQYPYAAYPAADQNPYAAYQAQGQPNPAGMPYAAPVQIDQWASQNAQADKAAFSNSATGGAINSGYFLGENSLWIGTIVQAVLETSINTDLPGNVIARITHNVYDSRTGKKLLVPQGTLLIAKYNSSISYAQNRVQIVWNTLVRPDGFYIELEGMPAVDSQGMSGQEAQYHENWFEYVKAAGIITMFSIANSKMADEAAKYASGAVQESIVAGNAEFVNQIGGSIVSKAMNIQPTLTVESATLINVMLNKTVYLPPVKQ